MTIADPSEAVTPHSLDSANTHAEATDADTGPGPLRHLVPLLGTLVFVVALIAVWQAWVTVGDVDPIVVPSPRSVADDILTDPGVYASATAQTLQTAALGLLIGTSAGFAVAVGLWWAPLAGAFAAPPLLLGRLLPVVVLIPVLARILGYGPVTVVAVDALLTFSFAYVLVGASLRAAPVAATEVVRSCGGSRTSVLAKVALPSAMPGLAGAIRLGAAAAVLGALAAEYLIGTDGLGALFAGTRLDYALIPRSWGVAVVASALSALVFLSTSQLERLARRRYT